jgi:hypothetical protein
MSLIISGLRNGMNFLNASAYPRWYSFNPIQTKREFNY